jgi:GT2 family glycosyltransferase
VSVIIPCFNYAPYVDHAITSVLTQSGVDVQVIVVDDASTDESVAVVRAAQSHDSRVRLCEQKINRGAVATFNHGLTHVQGEYIVRLDADDLLTPGSLERSVALAEAHPSVGLVYGHPLHFAGDVMPHPRTRARHWFVWEGHAWLRERCRTGVNVITSPEVLMRRSVVDVVGGQRELAHTHDMEMWLRIASMSDVGYVAGADQAWHREHDASLSQTLDPVFGDLQDRRDAFDVLFSWTERRTHDTAGLRILANRALADEALRAIVHMYDRNKLDVQLRSRYLTFAAETPTGAEPLPREREVARLMRRAAHRSASALQILRAAGRRVRHDVEWARWHREGVFTRGS